MTTPISQAMDDLIRGQERRHEWLFRAGEQIRKWKEEEGDLASPTVATQASPGAAKASPPSGECQLSQGGAQ